MRASFNAVLWLASTRSSWCEQTDRVPSLLWARRAASRLTAPQKEGAGRRCASFSSLACPDAQLFQSLMTCEHCLRGFTNRDIGAQLAFSFVPAGTITQSKAPGQRRFY